jgi:RimJ/RimL family protein N-acetyltransferase
MLRGRSGSPAQAAILRHVEIRTRRLVLRRPRATDLSAVVAACQDPDIPRFIPYVPAPYREEDGRAFLDSVERAWAESDERTFAICACDDILVGAVTVRLREGGAVGYWLAPAARGQGLMTEAVRAVVRWAAEEHGVECLRLWTHPENIASQAVAERAGFVRIGVCEHTPPFRDGTTLGVEFELRGP